MMQLNVEERRRPASITRRASICICISVVLIVSILATIIMWRNKISATKLVPPNPEVKLPPSPSVLRVFNKGAVCTDGTPCSEVGRNILKQGGTAADAAIAALFCNGVLNAHSMGIGGGFMMVIYSHKNRKADCLIAREKAPMAADKYMYSHSKSNWADIMQPSRTGGLAIGVPGELRGYWEAWKKYGRLEWAKLVEPSIQFSCNGYNMTKHQYDMLFFRKTAIKNDPNLREAFIDPETNSYKPIGSLVRFQKLCSTLRLIASEGGDVLNDGPLTKTLAEDIKEHGGIITEHDLKAYKPEWVQPISVTLHGGETVYSTPPPGSGAILTYILSILDGYNISAMNSDSFEKETLTIHRMVEAFKFAFARRTELADPNFINMTELLHKLTSKTYGKETCRQIKDDKTFQEIDHYGAVYHTTDGHGTAHISVLSPDGDAVSVTSTVNLYFGAGITSRRTGVVLNSVMDDFSIPDRKNYFLLPPSPNNFIAPEKRPLSSISPAIVVDPDQSVRLVIGASGGTKIPTAIAWVIIRHLWFGEDIKKAVDASRIHHQLMPMHISYEYGVLQQTIDRLEQLGHETHRYRERGSIICAVARDGGKVYGNADFRKGGDVYGID
ncbi:scoloptoxin SSD14-like isoform X3 [Rhodnius prolixus]|uniref:scoloptoxin SSD14-like isoform X3 n=1 Tax=Rhodnius prolixus TaxID=13249 RepID=UPI003D188318